MAGYDLRSRPLGYAYTVPSIPGLTADGSGTTVAGSYTFDQLTYRTDDQMTSYRSGQHGGLPAETVTTGYNQFGFPVTLFGTNSYVSATSFTADARVASRTYGTPGTGPSATRTFGYIPATGQIADMNLTDNTGAVLQHDMLSYDANGNLLATAHAPVNPANPAAAANTECYMYDGRNRLEHAYTTTVAPTPPTCATGAGVAASGYDNRYTIDDIGNLTSGPAGIYTYPNAQTSHAHAPARIGAVSLGWNADGTLATRTDAQNTTSYQWDPFNRLTGITTGTNTSKMVYWPGGQRAVLADQTGIHLFLDSIAERHINPDHTRDEKRYYTVAGTTVAVRTRHDNQPPHVTYLFGDIRGSITVTIDETGTITQQSYDPYGTIRNTRNVTVTSRGYIGQHTDPTGLTYLNNRYQDPTLGIFLSVDPLVSKTLQPYLYAAGNPTTLSDQNGLEPGSWNNTSREYWVGQFFWKLYAAQIAAVKEAVQSKCQGGCSQPPSKKFENFGGQQYQVFESAEEVEHEYLDDALALLERRSPTNTGGGEFTVGLDWDFCIFVCIPNFGISSEGPYLELGVGVQFESPGLELSSSAPECGARSTVAEVGVGVGVGGTPVEVGYSASAERAYGSSDWQTSSGFNVGADSPGKATHSSGFHASPGGGGYKMVSVSAGVHHSKTFC